MDSGGHHALNVTQAGNVERVQNVSQAVSAKRRESKAHKETKWVSNTGTQSQSSTHRQKDDAGQKASARETPVQLLSQVVEQHAGYIAAQQQGRGRVARHHDQQRGILENFAAERRDLAYAELRVLISNHFGGKQQGRHALCEVYQSAEAEDSEQWSQPAQELVQKQSLNSSECGQEWQGLRSEQTVEESSGWLVEEQAVEEQHIGSLLCSLADGTASDMFLSVCLMLTPGVLCFVACASKAWRSWKPTCLVVEPTVPTILLTTHNTRSKISIHCLACSKAYWPNNTNSMSVRLCTAHVHSRPTNTRADLHTHSARV